MEVSGYQQQMNILQMNKTGLVQREMMTVNKLWQMFSFLDEPTF